MKFEYDDCHVFLDDDDWIMTNSELQSEKVVNTLNDLINKESNNIR